MTVYQPQILQDNKIIIRKVYFMARFSLIVSIFDNSSFPLQQSMFVCSRALECQLRKSDTLHILFYYGVWLGYSKATHWGLVYSLALLIDADR